MGKNVNEQFYSSLVIAAKIAQDLDFTKILYEDMTNFFATRRLVLPMATWYVSLVPSKSVAEFWSNYGMLTAVAYIYGMDVWRM